MPSPGFMYDLYSPTNCLKSTKKIQEINPINQPDVLFSVSAPIIF